MHDRAIRYVVLAARYGSLTAAAQRIGVTQSAITKSIGDLERRLGFLIFDRTARGVIVTREGRAFIERASRVLDDLDRLMRATHRSDPFAGPLRIGVGPAVLEWLVLKPVAEMIKRYPQVKIDVRSATFDGMVEQLRNSTVDVALGLDAAWAEQPDFRREPMSVMRTSYFVRHGHPLLKKRQVVRADLAKYDFVAPSISRPYGADIREIYESAGVDPDTRMHAVDYWPLVRLMVSKSNAIGVTLISHGKSEAFQSRFGLIDLDPPITPSLVCCAVRMRWERPMVVRAFIDVCRESLQQMLK